MPDNLIAPNGPYTLEAKFYFISNDGTVAKATFDLNPGLLPTRENLAEAEGRCLHELVLMMPDAGFRPCTRHEFVQELLSEDTGLDVDFAVPGPDAWE